MTGWGRPIAARDLAPALLLCAFGALLLAGLPWPCPLRLLTGLPCPSCGLTRATRLALRGHFAAATAMHPLWVVILPALGALAFAECIGFARRRVWGTALDSPRGKRLGFALVVLLVVVWVARFCGAFGGPAPV